MKKRLRVRHTRRREILLLIGDTGVSRREFLSGIALYARAQPQWTTTLREMSGFGLSAAHEKMVAGGYDGVIVDWNSFLHYPEISYVADMPVVIFGSYRELGRTKARVVFVQSDNAESGVLGAKHLFGNGNYRALGFVPSPDNAQWSMERAKAFADEAARKGKQIEMFDRSVGHPLERWLLQLPKPAGVMAACDILALEVLETCHLVGIDVPRQLGVLGVDNDELICEFNTPSLSSIQPAHKHVGFLSAKTLGRMFRGWYPDEPRQVVCRGANVVMRESTAPISPVAALVEAAIAFIAKNASRAISPDDVARELHVSRSLLDLRFRQFEKATIAETIRNCRLELVKKHLLTTRLPVTRIAALLGYPNVSHLEVIFRKRFGDSMNSWRTARSYRP